MKIFTELVLLDTFMRANYSPSKSLVLNTFMRANYSPSKSLVPPTRFQNPTPNPNP